MTGKDIHSTLGFLYDFPFNQHTNPNILSNFVVYFTLLHALVDP